MARGERAARPVKTGAAALLGVTSLAGNGRCLIFWRKKRGVSGAITVTEEAR